MFQIPWQRYSEEEIQEVLTSLYKQRGYEVYNVHKVDRRGEEGADLECTKPGETDKILIGVKKKPKQKDIRQLNTLANRTPRTKIYVYIEEPSTSFRRAMRKLKDKVSFWNSEKLTCELFCTDVRFYLFMIIENNFEKDIYDITFSFCRVYLDLEENGPKFKQPAKAEPKMLNLLWQAKDRSASLHKSLRTLQTLFEEMDLSTIDEGTKQSVTNAFLKSLNQLHFESLAPLSEHFHEFLKSIRLTLKSSVNKQKGGRTGGFLGQTCHNYLLDI